MDICFLITTYNRKESCQRLVDSLRGIGDITVLGDCVDYTISGCKFMNRSEHYGRAGYWHTVKKLFAIRGSHQYYMMLPDDFLICESQIIEAIEIWNGIDDPLKICLNLYMDRYGLRCWTKFYPEDKGSVWQTGWVDMCFLCEESFFRHIRLKQKIANNSSGVGAQISRQLFQKGFHFYQVKDSLVSIQDEHYVSQMHSDEQVSHHRHSLSTPKRRVFDTRRRGGSKSMR